MFVGSGLVNLDRKNLQITSAAPQGAVLPCAPASSHLAKKEVEGTMKRLVSDISYPSHAQILCVAFFVLLTVSISGVEQASTASDVTVHTSALNLQDGREFRGTYVGPSAFVRFMKSGTAVPLTLVSDDFDRDGVEDLISGYAIPGGGGLITLRRGNREALAPQDAETIRQIAAGRFPPPFHSRAKVFEVPVAPEFMEAGDFNRDGHSDLIITARGSAAVFLIEGDGVGEFRPARKLELPGVATTMVVGEINEWDGIPDVIVGVSGGNGPQVAIYQGGAGRIGDDIVSVSLPSDPAAFALAQLDDAGPLDLAVATGNRVVVIHGRASGTAAPLRITEAISMPSAAVGLAAGEFILDRDGRTELAILTQDGSVQLMTRGMLDTRPLSDAERAEQRRLLEAEGTAGLSEARIGPLKSTQTGVTQSWVAADRLNISGSKKIFSRSRLSTQPGDELLVSDATGRRLQVVRMADGIIRGDSVDLEVEGVAVAALSMRLNVDGRPDLVILRAGEVNPSYLITLAAVTFTVNSTADTVDATPGDGSCADAGGNCTLRAAVMEANALAGADMIVFSPSTNGIPITLSITGSEGAVTGSEANMNDLDINEALTITGNGPANTIVQAGASTATGIDRVFQVNAARNATFDSSIVGLTVRHGRSATSRGGGIRFSGENQSLPIFTFDGTLVIDNCVFTANESAALGGGIFSEQGVITITNTEISSNTSLDGGGGGIFHHSERDAPSTVFTMTGCTVTGNQAQDAVNDALNTGNGGGVGVDGESFHVIQSTNISGNQAEHDGGGMLLRGVTSIPGDTLVSGNTAGRNGGGIYHDLEPVFVGPSGDSSLSGVTITGNTAVVSGGAIFHDRDVLGIEGCTIGGTTTADRNTALNGGGIATFPDVNIPAAPGAVNIIDSPISGNNASSNGGGIFNDGRTVQISGLSPLGGPSADHANTATNGGAIANNSGSLMMTGGLISRNAVTGDGGGVSVSGGSVTLSELQLTNNSAGGSGGALFVSGGSLGVSLSRLVGNSAASGSGIAQTGGIANVENNWWGCDGFPNAAGCQTGTGTFDADPRLDLRLTASPSTIPVNGSSTLTADVNLNSDGATVFASVLESLIVTFAADSLGTITPPLTGIISGGTVIKTYTAGSVGGLSTVSATLDSGTQTAIITIEQPPGITCPGNFVGSASFGTCSLVVTYSVTAVGFPVPTVNCAPPSGSSFNVGVTTVNCSASSSLGTANCSFTVTVNDTQLPQLACPSNFILNIPAAGPSCQIVNYTTTFSDNCPGATLSCVPPSGTCFPVGTTTVNCTATDASANTRSCSFTVTVTNFDVCLQSDDGKKILRFSSVSGDYRFIDCAKAGTTITGKGTVTKPFCKIELKDSAAKVGGNSVSAVANTCTGVGTATFTTAGVVHKINDSNINNNTCGCP